jgi:uncharacterized repeat protein (TIGR03803 family)
MGRLSWRSQTCFALVLCVTTAIASRGQGFTLLHNFHGVDGADSYAALVQGTSGDLYGTTSSGGTGDRGTVFKMTTSGTLTTLYNFCSQSGCTDGASPEATLIQASDGNFYGTTNGGGNYGEGTVFRITQRGTLTSLYSFCSLSGCTDGAYPSAGLVEATDGNLYGTTSASGANGAGGTVFRITPSGALTTLYSFCSQTNCTDGANPLAALIQATDGNFYGTTYQGGAGLSIPNSGTVFTITLSGALTILYSFCSQTNCTDGAHPSAALIQAPDGNFYGTTRYGGTIDYPGTVYTITLNGALTTLHNFLGISGDRPDAGLVQATNGEFYGTTLTGANPVTGTVYELGPNGAARTLVRFCVDRAVCGGAEPRAPLIQATDGKLYGTTSFAGKDLDGTVFSLSVGLGPFLETQPTSGKVGAGVNILGTNLTGATSVTFNGTPAVFTVVSGSLITATVPTGAASGEVQVVTPGGTLTSHVPFRMLP